MLTTELARRKMIADMVDGLVKKYKLMLFRDHLEFSTAMDDDDIDGNGFWASLFDSWGRLCEAASKAGWDRLFDYVVLVVGHPSNSFVSPVVDTTTESFYFPIHPVVASEIVEIKVDLVRHDCDTPTLIYDFVELRSDDAFSVLDEAGIDTFLTDEVHDDRTYLYCVDSSSIGKVVFCTAHQTTVFYRTLDNADDEVNFVDFPLALMLLSWDDAASLFTEGNLDVLGMMTREAVMSYYPAGV